jgi:bifunctional UDP-N-acetylglucosamine pyrophosphorylase / glucosamine-1-phosphate N-acetyltransferase
MKSMLPKVLHRLCGKPMVAHVLDAVRAAGFGPIVVVVGHGAAEVAAACGEGVAFVEQKEQLGTGHAVQMALPHLAESPDISEVVVVFGE